MNTEPKVGWIHIWTELPNGQHLGRGPFEGIYLGQHGGYHFWRSLPFHEVPACPRTSALSHIWVTPVMEWKPLLTEDAYNRVLFED